MLLECIFLPPATKLEQGIVCTGVCDSVKGGGAWSRGCLVLEGCLLWGGLLLGGVPGGDTPPPGWPLLQAVHILLECILVFLLFFTFMGWNEIILFYTCFSVPRMGRGTETPRHSFSPPSPRTLHRYHCILKIKSISSKKT